MLVLEASMHGQSPLSNDLRQRVIEVIDRGLSCRQAAERFGVSASSAIRWLDRLKKQGDVAAKRQGGDRKSGRIEAEAAFLIATGCCPLIGDSSQHPGQSGEKVRDNRVIC